MSIGADRLDKIPPYLFAELDRRREQAKRRGLDIIDLGVGDPDLPAPEPVVRVLAERAAAPETHAYPPYEGIPSLREAIASYYERRFSVHLDPDREVLVLSGSKEGLAHLSMALLNSGDRVLVPDPAYPVYATWAAFCGAEVIRAPLLEENGFKVSLDDVAAAAKREAALCWTCFPNNPTSSVASTHYFEKLVEIAAKHGMVVANDNAYAEIYYSERDKPGSILSVPGAKEVCVEFGSFSKTFNMCGFRLGWIAGNRDVVEALKAVKKNTDSGVFTAIQEAGAEALNHHSSFTKSLRETYRKRRDAVCPPLQEAGLAFEVPRATFFVWCRVPGGLSSAKFASGLLDQTGVVVTPGNGFGQAGEGYFRISLTQSEERLARAGSRISEFCKSIG